MSPLEPKTLRRVASRLRRAKVAVVFTGAGASAESGVPTFRDTREGLWAKYDPEELATRGGFKRNPKVVWEWYAWRRSLVEQAEPNPGHLAIAALERYIPQVSVVTQNIDDLHQRAGSTEVIQLHGSLFRYKCFAEEKPIKLPKRIEEIPPRCSCGSFLRPDVVWFGEAISRDAWKLALDRCQHCEVMLIVGTSAVVQPAASLPWVGKGFGATLIEVNPEETELTPMVEIFLSGKAGEVLPQLLDHLAGSSRRHRPPQATKKKSP